MIASAAQRLVKACRNYRNPFGMLAQRLLKRELLTITDRRTGLTFRYRRAAHNMFGEVFHLGHYDVPFLTVRHGDVVVDVGANHGFFTCLAASQGATVHAFEPDPSLAELLTDNVDRNGLTGSVVCRTAAVGATNGDVELFLSDRLGGGTNTLIPAFAPAGGARITVPCVRLEDALPAAAVPRIRLCKLDCEGAEMDIFRSLGPEFRARTDGFVMEFHPGAYDLGAMIDLIDSWGDFHIAVPEKFWPNGNILYLIRTGVIRDSFAAMA
jgi:FkbM family methyltransferase